MKPLQPKSTPQRGRMNEIHHKYRRETHRYRIPERGYQYYMQCSANENDFHVVD
jgi:hypothetical protein